MPYFHAHVTLLLLLPCTASKLLFLLCCHLMPANPLKLACACRNAIIIAWEALPGTTATLTKDKPLNENNPVAMELTTGGGELCRCGHSALSIVDQPSGHGAEGGGRGAVSMWP